MVALICWQLVAYNKTQVYDFLLTLLLLIHLKVVDDIFISFPMPLLTIIIGNIGKIDLIHVPVVRLRAAEDWHYSVFLTKETGMRLSQFHDRTPYTIMFGPENCGNDHKV